jgi:hypothetical protein
VVRLGHGDLAGGQARNRQLVAVAEHGEHHGLVVDQVQHGNSLTKAPSPGRSPGPAILLPVGG